MHYVYDSVAVKSRFSQPRRTGQSVNGYRQASITTIDSVKSKNCIKTMRAVRRVLAVVLPVVLWQAAAARKLFWGIFGEYLKAAIGRREFRSRFDQLFSK